MDRLTARNESGQAYYPKCFKEPRLGIGDCADMNCEQQYEVCEKLATYEDTGFTPEQIKETVANIPDAIEMCKIKIALDNLKEYQEIGTLDEIQNLMYLKNRYEDESYDFCGEYGTEECQFKDLTDADSKDLLQRLPCEVGDTVYIIYDANVEYGGEAIIEYCNVSEVSTDRIWIENNSKAFHHSDIGKTVYLTCEEAEAVLAKMKESGE